MKTPSDSGAGPQHFEGHSHRNPHHDHHHLREASRRSLLGALALTALLMVAEVVASLLTGSLSLIAHAAHMVTDTASLGLALLAIRLANRPASALRTYGYNRAEILAAAVNVLLLWLFAGFIAWEAISRFGGDHQHGGHDHEFEGGTVLVMGVLAIVVRLAAARMLSRSRGNLNVEGALRHIVADVVASAGLVVSGILVLFFGEAEWVEIIDPLFSVLLVLLILFSSWQLLTSVFLVLIEGTPEHLDLYELCHDMEEVPGVTVIHDIHIWTVTSGYVALTAHVLADPDHAGDYDEMLRELRRIASKGHDIAHTTIQLETSVRDCTEDHHVDHLLRRQSERRRRKFLSGYIH